VFGGGVGQLPVNVYERWKFWVRQLAIDCYLKVY